MLEKWFKLKEHNTTVRTEVTAGITTFLAMAYILAVNPLILGEVMNANGVFVATAIASAVATFLMAFLANYPIALSAGMGLNAYFAYTVCMNDLKGVENPFMIALTAVFVEGIIFIVISAFKFREQIINGIPQNLKFGITTGIGLFIALIGMRGAGVVVRTEDSNLIGLGNFDTPQMALCLIGVLIIVILSHYKVKGSVLIGILLTWILGIIAQYTGWYEVGGANLSLLPDFSHGLLNLGGIKETAKFLGLDINHSKIIVAHLGNGASISAVKDGKSIDTSMGLTPLAGVVMGTRCGDIDPSIVQFISDREHINVDAVLDILNKESGVYGLSGGLSSDFRDLWDAADNGNEAAQEALNVFCYRVANVIGSYVAVLNGVDAIAFTAGIGENDSPVRETVMSYFGYLGIKIDKEINKQRGIDMKISTDDSKVDVVVIPTNEELMICRETVALVK